jgi:caa(3)-type oxidase subunit IV
MSQAPSNPSGAPGHGHAHESKRALYLQNFVALTVLTVAEVGLTFVLKDAALIAMLVLACIAKVVLVGGIFMHLKFEVRTLVLIVCLPLVFSAILFVGLMPDSASWGLERMPGTPSFRR